ncbi:MAG: hypothetical protein ACOY5R_09230 [Pseudomonadota bacterium]
MDMTMRLRQAIRTMHGDRKGKGALRFALGTCVVAVAVALTVPGLLSRGALDNPVFKLRQHLPAALDRIRDAMQG